MNKLTNSGSHSSDEWEDDVEEDDANDFLCEKEFELKETWALASDKSNAKPHSHAVFWETDVQYKTAMAGIWQQGGNWVVAPICLLWKHVLEWGMCRQAIKDTLWIGWTRSVCV